MSDNSDEELQKIIEESFPNYYDDFWPINVLNIHPSSGSVEGGLQFIITLTDELSEDDISGIAQFAGIGYVHLEKLNAFNLKGIIPPSPQPGRVPVTVSTQSGQRLGKTDFMYVDEKQELLKKLVSDPVTLSQFFAKLSQEHGILRSDSNIAQNIGPFTIQDQGLIPTSILARGADALAAYHRALKSGSTFDKRVKVLLIGQDRGGKTSLGKSLKGELFDENEPSTDGVQMDLPMKNVDIQPWSNSVLNHNTTVLDHKCAVIISDKLRLNREPGQPKKQQLSEELAGEKDEEQAGEAIHVPENPKEEKSEGDETGISHKNKEEKDTRNVRKQKKGNSDVGDQGTMPDEMIPLIEENLKNGKAIDHEGIWPVIWDFAGQAVYRAIHPIFMSPEAIYVLVLDLTKKLFETAHCHVKLPGRNEEKVAGPDSEDTNLDHIMRWMDSVHSLKQSDSLSSSLCKTLPPVILVGTHVDKLVGNFQEEKTSMSDELSTLFTKDFSYHISGRFVIDNTKAGNSNSQEDSQVVDLRQHIIDLASELPHIKKKIPLTWLRVEKEIYNKTSQGEKYVAKQVFKDQIAEQFCQFDREGDFEELLHFLHARGTIVYHDCSNDEDSLVVLDPKWLIRVLCQIITAKPNEFFLLKRHKKLQRKGILAEELIDEACKKLELERIKEPLISIMRKFNLICQWKKNMHGKLRYYVPCMLTTMEEVNSINTSRVPAPVYLTFNTKYVPSGLFSRLVVLFWNLATSRSSSSCKQPQLFANAAKFFVGDVNCIEFVCYKRVIRLRIWAQDESNPLENQPRICEEILSHLENNLEKLRRECHWLYSMAWDLCAQCDLCKGQVDTNGFCHWHKKQGCSHSDCAHHIPLQARPFCCKNASGDCTLLPRDSFQPWIDAWNVIKKTDQIPEVQDAKPEETHQGATQEIKPVRFHR